MDDFLLWTTPMDDFLLWMTPFYGRLPSMDDSLLWTPPSYNCCILYTRTTTSTGLRSVNAFATRACAHEGILDLAASAHRLAHEAKCAVLRLSQQEQRMRVGVGTGARESQMCETPRASASACEVEGYQDTAQAVARVFRPRRQLESSLSRELMSFLVI